MKINYQPVVITFIILLLFGTVFWFSNQSGHPRQSVDSVKNNADAAPPNQGAASPPALTASPETKSDTQNKSITMSKVGAESQNQTNQKTDSNFPINDKIELPFIGAVQCHAREEQVEFTSEGKKMKWPFRVYYLPNGLFVRAVFIKAGSNILSEVAPKELEIDYNSGGEKLVGFPDNAAPASLGKVLQNLYENEAFDKATKISITWVLRKDSNDEIKPCFMANIFGVSAGIAGYLGRVPLDDESYKKYRIILSPEGAPLFMDNAL